MQKCEPDINCKTSDDGALMWKCEPDLQNVNQR